MKLDIWFFFLPKHVEEIKVSLNFTTISGTLREDYVHLWLYLIELFLKREMFPIKVEDKL